MVRGSRRLISTGAAVMLLAVVTACGNAAPPGSESAAGAPAAAGFPVTVADCNGLESTFEQPPQRAVPLSAPMMEFLFWLGVQDRILATGEAPTGLAYPEQFRAGAERIEVIADPFVPGQDYLGVPFEALLEKQADFVVSDYTTTFVSFSQQDLTQRGIPSYLTVGNECTEGRTGPRVDLQAVQQDVENLGKVFGVPDRAAELVAGMDATVAGVAGRLPGGADRPRVLYLSGEFMSADQPGSAYGNQHVLNAILELAGARNVFSDVDAAYQTVGWEEMAARDPDVILVGGYGYGGQEDYDKVIAAARDTLATHPATRNLRVVTEGRVFDIDGWLVGAAGVRNADGVAAVARLVHPTAFP